MQVESIQLKHALLFSDLKLDLQYHELPITLILGKQSSGKTTLVRLMYQALSWFAARYKDSRTAGVVMLDQDIMFSRLQAKINIQVRFPEEIGHFPESSDLSQSDLNQCSWQLYKTMNQRGMGISKVDTQQLEAMVALYQKAQQADPLVGLPLIAYYPTERFVHDINLISKNNAAIFQNAYAYEISAIPYTTFARFFEWFREINDIENAQSSHLLQQILHQNNNNGESSFTQQLAQSYAQMSAPGLEALNSALQTVLPEFHQLYLEYHPKLQLMVNYQGQNILYNQLSNSIRNLIALVGDVVRRLCLLNPNSLYPCAEGEGILIIDSIDHQLDQDLASVILQRLHDAFPRLQIIATGSHDALLENAEGMQCFRLQHHALHPIQTQHSQQQFDAIYSQLALTETESNNMDLPEPANQLEQVEQLYLQLQTQLTPEQQHSLARLLQDEPKQKTADHLPD